MQPFTAQEAVYHIDSKDLLSKVLRNCHNESYDVFDGLCGYILNICSGLIPDNVDKTQFIGYCKSNVKSSIYSTSQLEPVTNNKSFTALQTRLQKIVNLYNKFVEKVNSNQSIMPNMNNDKQNAEDFAFSPRKQRVVQKFKEIIFDILTNLEDFVNVV